MINRTILTIITIVLFIGIVSAVDFTPSGDINMRGIYSMKNATNVTAINFTASGYFIGDGSKLTGILASIIGNNLGWLNWTQITPHFYFKNQTYNKTEVDSELEKYLYINGSRQMTGNLNVRGSGNFSGTIYINNGTDISTIGGGNESWNQSLANTIYYSISNPLNFMNWTQIIPHFYFKNQTYNKSEIDNNLSLRLEITDQRYNETGLINSVNSTLQNVNTTLSGRIDTINNSLSIYNDTNKINSVNSTLNLVATNASINHTSIVFGLWNSTWDNNWVNQFAYNHTSSVFTIWGQWFYNMTTPAIDYVNNNFIQKGTADAWVIKYQNVSNIPTCAGTDKLKFDGTTLSCATDEVGAPGSGDIESVTGDDFITNGSTTGPVNLIFNKTRLNETIINKGVDAGFNRTDNATYAGFITFNQTSLIANLTNGDCTAGSLVIGIQANGTVLCATDSSYNATYAGFTTFNQSSLLTNLTQTDCAAGTLVIGINTNGTVLCATDAGSGNYFNQQLNTTSNVTFVNITMINGSGDTFFLKRVFVYGIDLNITIYNSNLSNYNLGMAVNNTAKLVYTINTTANIQNLLNSTGIYSIPLTINTTVNIQNLYNSTALMIAQIINTTVNIQSLFNATLFIYSAPNTTLGIQALYNGTASMIANASADGRIALINTTVNIQNLYNATLKIYAAPNTTAGIQYLINGTSLNLTTISIAQNLTMRANYSINFNGKHISSNDTCIIIKGATSTDYIC